AGLLLQGEHILTFFDHAVIITLWAAPPSPATLDDVDGKMLGQGASEGSVVGSHRECAGNNNNRLPTSRGEIANLRPILGEHGVGGVCAYVTRDHHFSFFILPIRAWCNRSVSSRKCWASMSAMTRSWSKCESSSCLPFATTSFPFGVMVTRRLRACSGLFVVWI